MINESSMNKKPNSIYSAHVIVEDNSTTSCQPMDVIKSNIFEPSTTPTTNSDWDVARHGHTTYMEPEDKQDTVDSPKQSLMGVFRATSIAGNVLVASVLYSVGPCIVQAGKYAPISMFMVSLIMYPVKQLMTEVVTTLPLNGGTYNAMLHTTSKWFATVASCFSILDYLATCGVSSSTAAAYLTKQVALPRFLSPFCLALIIIICFSLIYLLGIRESSTVSLVIFILHLLTMTVLLIAGIVQWARTGNNVLVANWNLATDIHPARAILNGFSVGLLGVTGIEAAENYVQELKPGVYPQTMRNMYVILFLLNAPMVFMVTVLVPIPVVRQNSASAVSLLAEYATPGQQWLRLWVTADAVISLCAGVLTGMIGAIGLISRLASDRIVSSFFLKQNRFTGSNHYSILVFLVLNVALCLIVQGDATSLSGVFAVAFLSVLTMYTLANLMMKYKRGRLPRLVNVNLPTVIFSLFALVTALISNMVIDPLIACYFAIYYAVVILVMMIMLKSCSFLKLNVWLLGRLESIKGLNGISRAVQSWLVNKIMSRQKQVTVVFIETGDPSIMNKAVLYVQSNEESRHIKFVHVYRHTEEISQQLETNHRQLVNMYPRIRMDLVLIQGTFDPSMVDTISKRLNVPKSFMFIGCPGPLFGYSLGEFGGVRIVMA